MRPLKLVAAFLVAFTTTSCLVSNVRIETSGPTEAIGTTVESPLKAFMHDGRIAVFPNGARITADSVLGQGSAYAVGLGTAQATSGVPLADVLGIESFTDDANIPLTVGATIGGVALVALGAVGIACAADPKCFGSCPTIYSFDADGHEVLEAEAFSYSIAPLLEGRDTDRLGIQPGPDGIVRLELRNEALETHYINQMELLEVRHAPGQAAFPAEDGRILVVGEVLGPIAATDRDGSDRLPELARRDGTVFASSDARLQAVTAEDFRDHVDLVFPKPEGDSAAFVLRLRNSLLNTVLFYDLMLASQGAEALDWLGDGMARVGDAVELGRWFQETMGMEVYVRTEDGWERVTRVPDSGPLAWEELAVEIPTPDTDELQIRISFLADEWRIDYAGVAPLIERADVHVIPFHSVSKPSLEPDAELAERIADPDEDYLVTTASAALTLEASPESFPADERTFFLSSQGYYSEWMRPDWVRADRNVSEIEPFRPSGETIVRLMDRWIEEKDQFQARFFETRIPVR